FSEDWTPQLSIQPIALFSRSHYEERVNRVRCDERQVGEAQQPGVDGRGILDLEGCVDPIFLFINHIDVIDVAGGCVEPGSEILLEFVEIVCLSNSLLVAGRNPYLRSALHAEADQLPLHSYMVGK